MEKMRGILLNLCVIILFVDYGFAIQCYICDSSVNPKCADLSDKSIVPETCTYDKLGNTGNSNSWLMSLSELNYYKGGATVEIPMVCQKIIGIDDKKQQSTLRRCQLENVDPCNFAKNHILTTNKKIEHCSVCPKDACNGVNKNQIQWISVVFPAIVCIALTYLFM